MNRLAQPDVVGDQQPRAGVTTHGERRFELEGQEIDSSAGGIGERSEWTGEDRANENSSCPALVADYSRRLREIGGHDPIEREEKRARGSDIRCRHSGQSNGVAVGIRAVTRDVP